MKTSDTTYTAWKPSIYFLIKPLIAIIVIRLLIDILSYYSNHYETGILFFIIERWSHYAVLVAAYAIGITCVHVLRRKQISRIELRSSEMVLRHSNGTHEQIAYGDIAMVSGWYWKYGIKLEKKGGKRRVIKGYFVDSDTSGSFHRLSELRTDKLVSDVRRRLNQ